MTDSSSPPSPPSCGYVSIIGLPNAGKSTLLNALVGMKVSIVSRKVQTTRSRVLGIVMEENAQIILMDTPGVFTPKKTLEKAMVEAALDALSESDTVLHIVDARPRDTLKKNAIIIDRLPQDKKVILALNKVDDMPKPDLLERAQQFQDRFPYDRIFMISALKEKGLEDMQAYLATTMPEGPWMFPEDQATDMPMRMLAAEITREKIFDQLHEELPYSIFVKTENWENFDNGSIKISQVVCVEKENQKHIVIGKGGRRLKAIGQAARKELEAMLETRVHLNLFVKVQKNWHENAENYALMGLELPE